jgi:hypothetical protein
MACLFLAYALFPEPMKKAQEEVDRVIGTDRLPNFSDRSQLPYINATVLELLRYCGITPIGRTLNSIYFIRNVDTMPA